jgi:hypothetical protein
MREERKLLLMRLKKERKGNFKELSRRIKIPYATLLSLAADNSKGSVRSWLTIEDYFKKLDKPPAPST